MTHRSRHRVVLVREWDHQTTGASCCGRLDGEFREAADYARTRADMEAMGGVYRALRAELSDDVEVEIVDPRNTAWLVPALVRDAWRAEPRVGHVVQTLRRGTGQGAVVVDGRVVSCGPIPPTVIVLRLVREALRAA